MDIERLIQRYPRLYHMAECGSWPSIQRHGLLSTTALLDLYGITGAHRDRLESRHRPEKYSLSGNGLGDVVIRDQKPMSDHRLSMCLQDGLSPHDWYRLLNGKVFFWVSHERLLRLLNARAYRNEEHDVLTIHTEPLVRQYQNAISLCHINSGNTFPVPHRRGNSTFKGISDYEVNPRTGRPTKEVVELVIEYSVPNIAEFVESVSRMKRDQQMSVLYQEV